MTAAEQLAGILASALEQQAMPLARATPRQQTTAATPEEVDLVIDIRRHFADLLTGDADRPMLARRLRDMADLVDQAPPTIVEVEQ
jgi:hypothetical protein